GGRRIVQNTAWQLPSGLWVRFGRPSHHRNEITLMRSAHFCGGATMFSAIKRHKGRPGNNFQGRLLGLLRALLSSSVAVSWNLEGWQRWQSPCGYLLRGASAGVTISQPRPMIELRDLPTEGGLESVPVSRPLLNHPVSYARQNPEFRFLPLRWTAMERRRGSWKGSRHRLAVALRVVGSLRSPFHTEMRSPS